MTARRFVLGALATAAVAASAAAGAFAAAQAGPGKPTPCKGIRNCITVNGPWVAVPATGTATFLLECPKRNGYVAGIDTLASSTDVRALWEARLPQPPSPLSKATTSITGPYVLFTAVSAGGKRGLLQPWIGCVPTPPTNPRVTTSARVAPRVTKPGAPVDRWQTTLDLHAGHQTGSRGCGKGERLVDGWQSIAFKSDAAPDPALAAKVSVGLKIGDGRVAVSVQTRPGIPSSAFPEVQVGATCAK
jgi:hypothetical protein